MTHFGHVWHKSLRKRLLVLPIVTRCAGKGSREGHLIYINWPTLINWRQIVKNTKKSWSEKLTHRFWMLAGKPSAPAARLSAMPVCRTSSLGYQQVNECVSVCLQHVLNDWGGAVSAGGCWLQREHPLSQKISSLARPLQVRGLNNVWLSLQDVFCSSPVRSQCFNVIDLWWHYNIILELVLSCQI